MSNYTNTRKDFWWAFSSFAVSFHRRFWWVWGAPKWETNRVSRSQSPPPSCFSLLTLDNNSKNQKLIWKRTHPRSKLHSPSIPTRSFLFYDDVRRSDELVIKKKCSCCLEWLVVRLLIGWLTLTSYYIHTVCIDRPTPIAKLTSPLAYLNWNRIKFNERETTTEKNGEQDF